MKVIIIFGLFIATAFAAPQGQSCVDCGNDGGTHQNQVNGPTRQNVDSNNQGGNHANVVGHGPVPQPSGPAPVPHPSGPAPVPQPSGPAPQPSGPRPGGVDVHNTEGVHENHVH